MPSTRTFPQALANCALVLSFFGNACGEGSTPTGVAAEAASSSGAGVSAVPKASDTASTGAAGSLQVMVGVSPGAVSGSAATASTAASSAPLAASSSVSLGAISAASNATAPQATSGQPALVPEPVKDWGGKPLGMVPYAKSGTRLAAIGYSDDGAVFFSNMRDTQLGFDCEFEKAEAGDWLCSPKTRVNVLFLDAGCKQPAMAGEPFSGDPLGLGPVVGTTTSVSSAASSGGSDTVLVSLHGPVYRVAEKVYEAEAFGSSYEVYEWNSYSKQCVVAQPSAGKGVPSIYRLTPIADTELVKATTRDVVLQGGLTVERLVTDDGAELSGNLKLNGKPCQLLANGRCALLPLATSSGYSESSCKERAYALASKVAADVPVYALDQTTDGMLRVYDTTALGAAYFEQTRVDPPTPDSPMAVFVVTGCSATAADVSGLYYRRAQDITESLPKLESVRVGSALLYPTWYVGVVAANEARIQLQIHSTDASWVRPNIETSTGTVCTVYAAQVVTRCTNKDGLTSEMITQVKL